MSDMSFIIESISSIFLCNSSSCVTSTLFLFQKHVPLLHVLRSVLHTSWHAFLAMLHGGPGIFVLLSDLVVRTAVLPPSVS